MDQKSDAGADDQIERELAPGVMLYKEYKKVTDMKDVVGMFIWMVEITTMSVVDFEVHLDQSENIELEKKIDNELKTVSKILPFEKKEVAKVYLKNNWKLKSKFKLTMNVPDKSIQYSFVQKDEKLLEKQMQDGRKYLDGIPFEHMSREQIELELERLSMKFIDLDFPPNDDSMLNPRYDDAMKDMLDYIIHWRRPEEFSQMDPSSDFKELKVFNYNEPEPNDIHQGILPDNHLASAFSTLAEKYNLIKRLFKSEKYSKYGIYQVKLCISGEWTTVVVDDLFPCIPLSNPLVSRSPSNELWVLILEKAIAKVCESYYNLISTNISDFLLLLTGCPTIYLSLDDILKTEEKEGCLKKLKQFVVDKKYLTVAISKIIDMDNVNDNNDNNPEDDMLTIPNFGYTILDVRTKHKENLIVLRKVWYDGKKEENVKRYEDAFLKANPLLSNELNEGTLILAYEDFLKEFSSIAVCYAKNWDEVRIRGKFVLVKEQETLLETALSKWFYCVQLERTTNLIISLHQDEDKIKENDSRKQLMDISLIILKQDNSANEITHIQTLDFAHTPNVQIELSLPPGSYLILPRTTGCFFGRPFDKVNVGETKLYNCEEKKFTPVFIATIKDIFKKFDLLLNRKLGFSEFKGFWECINNSTIDEGFFEENILGKYPKFEGGITERGFIKFFEDCYSKDNGENVIRTWLDNLGYDADLYPLRSRCFMLTFHSDSPIAVSVRDALNTDLNSKVNRLVLKNFGEEKDNKKKSEIVAVEYQSKNNNIVTVGFVNKGSIPYRVVLTFNDYKNLLFSTKSPKIEKVVNPGQHEFFLHFFVLAGEKNFDNVDYNFSYFPVK